MVDGDGTATTARTVQEARRVRGWGASALAENAAVDVAVVERLEHGDDVDPEQLSAVCRALGLPEGHATVAVTQADPKAAAMDDFIRDAASRLPGILSRPDVDGMCAAKGWSAEALADAVRVEEAQVPWPVWFVGAFGVTFLVALLVTLGMMLVKRPEWVEDAFCVAAAAGLLAMISVGMTSSVIDASPQRKRRVTLDRVTERRKRFHRLGFVLSPGQVVVLRIRKGRLESRVHPSVEVRRILRRWHADGRHVSVTLRLTEGKKVRMPWLVRTPELEAVLSGWETRSPTSQRGGAGTLA